jgi:putative membrane protein
MAEVYLWVKSAHIVSFVAWMAAIFYLPRLYVYHADAKIGSELSETLKVMERKLLRVIMNPAMILTWGFGIWLVVLTGVGAPGGERWIHVKIGFVLLMTLFHAYLARIRRQFEQDKNTRSSKFYRGINEIPTILLIIIVLLAVVRPI